MPYSSFNNVFTLIPKSGVPADGKRIFEFPIGHCSKSGPLAHLLSATQATVMYGNTPVGTGRPPVPDAEKTGPGRGRRRAADAEGEGEGEGESPRARPYRRGRETETPATRGEGRTAGPAEGSSRSPAVTKVRWSDQQVLSRPSRWVDTLYRLAPRENPATPRRQRSVLHVGPAPALQA